MFREYLRKKCVNAKNRYYALDNTSTERVYIKENWLQQTVFTIIWEDQICLML